MRPRPAPRRAPGAAAFPGGSTRWRPPQHLHPSRSFAASSRLTKASSQGALAWDERYEAIVDIVEHQPPLYLAGGFSSEMAFFEKAVGEDRGSIYRNMRVAKYATAKEIETYGSSRLDAAITFLETKNNGPLKGRTPIDFGAFRFPVKGGTRKLAEATVEELREAIATLRGHELEHRSV